ncbi:MAG: ComF family protein [Thermoleophilia bacterium]|nr:ComF family protein [Thermoleophilia bacterium]
MGLRGAVGPLLYAERRERVRTAFCQVAESVLDVLFPPRCVGCGDFETYLCLRCRASLQEIGEGCCPRCGEPDATPVLGSQCAACVGRESSFVGARAAFVHKGAARELVGQFKSGGQLALGRLMAELARPAFTRLVGSLGDPKEVVITWVPCHKRTKQRRGYNQAEVLCRLFCEGSPGYAGAGLLCKVRHTKQQKELDRAARQKNLRGVFAMEPGWQARLPVHARVLVVVDDVFTTGATAHEVGSVLRQATGFPVYVFTFSRAVLPSREIHD